MSQPSQESLALLESLRRSVAHALEKKGRLGQYAVVWQNDHPVIIGNKRVIGQEPQASMVREDPTE